MRKYNTVKQAYLKNGLESISHGNSNRLPHHGFTTDDLRNIVTFLTNFSEENAILLPGRIPGYKRCDLQLLPTSLTKKEVWKRYIQACGTMTLRLASYCTFCRVWLKFTPLIIITTPKTDLCWTCQQNNRALMRSTNMPLPEKLAVCNNKTC